MPAIRLELQAPPESVSNRELAQREGTADASHRPQWLHATLNAAQEAVVVALRETLLRPLDDLLAVTHKFIHPKVSPLCPGPLSASPRGV